MSAAIPTLNNIMQLQILILDKHEDGTVIGEFLAIHQQYQIVSKRAFFKYGSK